MNPIQTWNMFLMNCLISRDISRGKEQVSIQCVNEVDDEPPPLDFLYVTENCETTPTNIDRTITSLQVARCSICLWPKLWAVIMIVYIEFATITLLLVALQCFICFWSKLGSLLAIICIEFAKGPSLVVAQCSICLWSKF